MDIHACGQQTSFFSPYDFEIFLYNLTNLLFQKLGLKDQASEEDRKIIYGAVRNAEFEYCEEDSNHKSSIDETREEIKNLKKEYEEEKMDYLKKEIEWELANQNKKLLKLTKERKALNESEFLRLIRQNITGVFNESVTLIIKKNV